MSNMDQIPHGNATISMMLSFVFSILTWITFKELHVILGLIASSIAILSGLSAIRYYWLAIDEKKRNRNKNPD